MQRSRGKKSKRDIARMTGLARNTVAKWLGGAVDGEPTYRRVHKTVRSGT
jgi:transcriptional regulator with XRE-family HTH domain